MSLLDPILCYRALRSRDGRFDGRVFVGVTSTGIYCRPVCPANVPKFENCRFFPSAAAAQEAGFRPCLRCRPETAPEVGSWRGTSNTVARGLALITEGVLDGDDARVEALAERLGVGERQLRRLFARHLGASPIAVAQTRRALFAKQLIHETRLPIGQVALAAGFGSVRRFNETFRGLFGALPSALRREGASWRASVEAGVTLRLRYRAPYDWTAMLAYLRARAVEGVEAVDEETYRRTVSVDGDCGTVEVAHVPESQSIAATIRFPSVRALPGIVARIRRVFDLGADVATIGAHLSQDPLLAPLVAARPGLRTPGAWDGFEAGVRSVLGQQVSLAAARRLAGRLVTLCGLPAPADGGRVLSLAFPCPSDVARAELGSLGMPRARRETLLSLARAAVADPRLFEPLETVEKTVERLKGIRGIGEWTAHVIALRAAGEPDAFPADDVALVRGYCAVDAARPKGADLRERAARWRPWRGYAAQHLWAADAASRSSAERRPQ